ncbi:hypothetical protein DESPIG_00298 [Desulfovibrio piger ATCC 29098]|uniref:Uncharacterized protein n=1 Tax=Desulfovibrio piger ATCC 29098 TaxID=411464 RepID=B6WQH4_9BACT|nr:hypothetical protein DESPIG_00298 [Desulfovibrio piger ATCC 29098]
MPPHVGVVKKNGSRVMPNDISNMDVPRPEDCVNVTIRRNRLRTRDSELFACFFDGPFSS